MTPDEIEAEAMKLDLASRIELVRRLTVSIPTPPAPTETSSSPPPETPKALTDDERERLWLQEAMARSRELKARQVQTEPPDTQGVFRPPTRPTETAARERPSRTLSARRSAAKRARPKPRPKPKPKPKGRPVPRRKPKPNRPPRPGTTSPRRPAKTRLKTHPRPRSAKRRLR